jgi:excisionase family DNA binding protein
MTTEHEPLLQYAETAKLLNVSVPTLKNWVRSNKIPYIRFPSRAVRFNPVDIAAWIETQTVAPVLVRQLKSKKEQQKQTNCWIQEGVERHNLKTDKLSTI